MLIIYNCIKLTSFSAAFVLGQYDNTNTTVLFRRVFKIPSQNDRLNFRTSIQAYAYSIVVLIFTPNKVRVTKVENLHTKRITLKRVAQWPLVRPIEFGSQTEISAVERALIKSIPETRKVSMKKFFIRTSRGHGDTTETSSTSSRFGNRRIIQFSNKSSEIIPLDFCTRFYVFVSSTGSLTRSNDNRTGAMRSY